MSHVFSVGALMVEIASTAAMLPFAMSSSLNLATLAVTSVSLLAASCHIASRVFPTAERYE